MPLGIGYLAARILQKYPETELDIIDTTFEKKPFESIKRRLSSANYDIVGISVMTIMLKDSLSIASIIKRRTPETKVIFGGPHPTVMPEETLACPQVDCVVIGEGEETLADIVGAGGRFKDIPGLWFKERSNLIKNAQRAPNEDLDRLPFPIRHLLPVDKYIKNHAGLDSVNPKLRCMGILATRGCPYRCSYCQPTLDSLFGKKLRKRSAENIIEELRQLKTRYGIDSFTFEDDTFIIDTKWVCDFCDKLIASRMNLVWSCNVRANLVTRELMKKLYDAGLRKVGIGIESGSQRILDEIYTKDITIEQIRKSVDIISSLGIKILGYVMIGAPTETLNEINQTIAFVTALNIDEAMFSITTPLPCTTLYKTTKELIKDDIGEFDYYKKAVYRSTGDLSPQQIEKLKQRAYLKFYLSPKHLLKTLKNLLSTKIFLNRLKRF